MAPRCPSPPPSPTGPSSRFGTQGEREMRTTSTHGASGATVPSPQRTVGIAMIGSGMMAKSHTMAFRNLRAVHGTLPVEPRLVVLCDTTPELAGAGAGSFG